ncbi:hypothetical protein Emed_007504 [Eimeria media]
MDRKSKLIVKSMLMDLAKKHFITHTSSPFGAPSMLVPKKSDNPGEPTRYCLVINYQELNKITTSAQPPLPNIQTIMEQLHGARFFTIMDMESGFHQVRVAPEDQHKTAFRTWFGHFEFKVMPFGLKGAPGTFQTIMNDILMEHVEVFCAVYLDDVLIYSQDLKTHVSDVAAVLQALRTHKLYPKISKCRFAQQSLDYLGYSIGEDGVQPSEERVADIQTWPSPLVELTKKNVPFVWGPEHTTAIRKLKARLAHYTKLQLPNPDLPYVVWTDASGYALGAVLLQEGRPLAFLSKKMNAAQLKYSTYQQELLALITALHKWQHLLRPAEVTAYTDHRSLQHLLTLKASDMPKGMVARWLDFLAEFPRLTITYKPGSDNVVADALSRNPAHRVTTPGQPSQNTERCALSCDVKGLPPEPKAELNIIVGRTVLAEQTTRSGRIVRPPRRPGTDDQTTHTVVNQQHSKVDDTNVRATHIVAVPSSTWNAHLLLPSSLAGFWGTQHTREIRDTADLQRATLGPSSTVGMQEWEKSLLDCPTYGIIAAKTRAESPRPLKLAVETAEVSSPTRVYRWFHNFLQVRVSGCCVGALSFPII